MPHRDRTQSSPCCWHVTHRRQGRRSLRSLVRHIRGPKYAGNRLWSCAMRPKRRIYNRISAHGTDPWCSTDPQLYEGGTVAPARACGDRKVKKGKDKRDSA